jgi:hypothetical protein
MINASGAICNESFGGVQEGLRGVLELGTYPSRNQKSVCGMAGPKNGFRQSSPAWKLGGKEGTELMSTAAIWDAIATWSSLWDLTKPVLLEKTPTWFDGVEVLHDALLRYTGPWPLRKVRPVYVAMWRPICLTTISSHFQLQMKHIGHDGKNFPPPGSHFVKVTESPHFKALQCELDTIARTVQIVKWAKRVGARMVLINYADVLWKPETAIARLKALLPCITRPGFNTVWKPKFNRDVFKGNNWKVKESIAKYSSKHQPYQSCYDLEAGRCQANFLSCKNEEGVGTENVFNNSVYTNLIREYTVHVDYLLAASSVEINL